MINRRFLRPNAANSMQNNKFQRQNAANSMQHGRFSSKMLQITRKMKGSSSKMLQIACSMEGKWQDRCRGRKTEQIRKQIPRGRGKNSSARFGTPRGPPIFAHKFGDVSSSHHAQKTLKPAAAPGVLGTSPSRASPSRAAPSGAPPSGAPPVAVPQGHGGHGACVES